MSFEQLLSESKSLVCLAPMAGVTDAVFRDLICSFGASMVISEMVSSEALVRNSQKTLRRLASEKNQTINIVQIMGCNPHSMSESAIINESLGAHAIDINMGCPAKKIISNNCGAALMKDENLALKIVESVVKSVRIPITVKMRLGWDVDNLNCYSLAKKFENAGVRMISVHCRTRNQLYSGHANWEALMQMRNIIKIPYLCNGDIKSALDAERALHLSHANGVMIGRATLGRPWMLRQVMNHLYNRSSERADFATSTTALELSIEKQYLIVMKHFEKTLDFYGQAAGIRFFRKHLCWYSAGLRGSSAFREKINRSDDCNFIKNCIKDFYDGCFHDIL